VYHLKTQVQCSTAAYLNPFPDEQLILEGHRAKTSLPFLHPKQNIERELKWQTC